MRDGGRRGQPSCPGFPSPFGHRHSLLGHPIPAGELGPPYGRLTGSKIRTSTGLPRCARSSCDRGGCLLYPEGGGALLTSPYRQPAPAALRRPALVPRSSIPSTGFRMTRHQRRFKPFTRPSAPRLWRPDTTGALGLFPELRTPPARSRTAHVGAGPGHEHGPGATRSTSVDPPFRVLACQRAPSLSQYGFRPGRSQHHALDALAVGIERRG